MTNSKFFILIPIGFILLLFGGIFGLVYFKSPTIIKSPILEELSNSHTHTWEKWEDPKWTGEGRNWIQWKHCNVCNTVMYKSVQEEK